MFLFVQSVFAFVCTCANNCLRCVCNKQADIYVNMSKPNILRLPLYHMKKTKLSQNYAQIVAGRGRGCGRPIWSAGQVKHSA